MKSAKCEVRSAKKYPTAMVIGTGMTKFGELWGESVESLAKQSVEEALDEAGLSVSDIDALVVGNMLLPMLERRAHVGRLIADAVGFHGPAFLVESACASGGLAVRQAVMAIASGMAKKVLVVGVEKMTDVDGPMIARGLMAAGSEEEQWAGATFPALYAIMHRAYQETYNITDKQMAAMAVWSHGRAINNPLAQFQKEITVDAVLQSTLVADPMRMLHCSPISDGAAALVLSASRSAHHASRKQPGIEIVGSGVGGDTLSLAKRKSLTSMSATKYALDEAVRQTRNSKFEIRNIDVVEVHDCFSVAGFVALEDLGFCGVGEAPTFLSNNSVLNLNPSGGLKACGHPVGATGVKQVVAVARELRKGKGWGLTQNVGGTGATAVVHLLKSQENESRSITYEDE